MALKDDLTGDVAKIFQSSWTKRNGTAVPSDTSVTMANDSVILNATVLYADLSESTIMVDKRSAEFSAEIYKSFLLCAAKIIKSRNGTITAYDGDRIMAVYLGGSKNTDAVKSALMINWACKNIIQPAKTAQYNNDFVLKHTVGIDTSELLVAKTGVRGSNDLVWVGRSANWAAKLCSLSHDYPTWITEAVFGNMHDEVKTGNGGVSMWEKRSWTAMNNASIYRSSWSWSL